MENKASDEDLVRMISSEKDQKAYEILYNRYFKKVLHKVLKFCDEEDEAEDLTHDIFLKVFNKLDTFEYKSKFSTWLYSITYNHLVNYAKKDKKKLSERWERLNRKSEITSLEDVSESEILAFRTEKLEKALEFMEPADRALLLMKYSDDITISEIVNTFNVSEGAIKMRLKRARQRLKEKYNSLP